MKPKLRERGDRPRQSRIYGNRPDNLQFLKIYGNRPDNLLAEGNIRKKSNDLIVSLLRHSVLFETSCLERRLRNVETKDIS